MLVQTAAVLCVVGLVIGQILFKASATSLSATGSFYAIRTATPLLARNGALCDYIDRLGLGAAKN